MQVSLWRYFTLIMSFLVIPPSALEGTFAGSPEEPPMRVTVKVILENLPITKQEKMKDFQEKVTRYMNEYDWLQTEDIHPFVISLQLFLEDMPSNIEDRYRCNILVSAPDVQYYDKRGVFPFQQGEALEHDGQYTPIKGLIDFYTWLAIASEFDKVGYLEGSRFFDKAKATMEQGKFSRFFTGWDRREELIKKIYSDNYKKFREMKDYYFYALSILPQDKNKAREYIGQAVEMLASVLENDRDLDAAKQFIDAHYQEITDLFGDQKNKRPIETLLKLDPDRKAIYEKFLQ